VNDHFELADTILSHDRELDNDHTPGEDAACEEPFQVISRDQLIDFQDKGGDLATLRDQSASESEAVQEPVSYYQKSGVLMRRWRPPDAQCDEELLIR